MLELEETLAAVPHPRFVDDGVQVPGDRFVVECKRGTFPVLQICPLYPSGLTPPLSYHFLLDTHPGGTAGAPFKSVTPGRSVILTSLGAELSDTHLVREDDGLAGS